MRYDEIREIVMKRSQSIGFKSWHYSVECMGCGCTWNPCCDEGINDFYTVTRFVDDYRIETRWWNRHCPICYRLYSSSLLDQKSTKIILPLGDFL